MSDLELEAQHKIHQVITRLHRLLSQNFTSMQQSRDLQPDQNMILSELSQRSVHYQNLVGILAIDTYVSSMLEHISKFDDIQALLTLHIENILNYDKNKQQTNGKFKSIYSSLMALVHAFHQYAPQSNYVQIHRRMLSVEDSSQMIGTPQRQIFKLRQQNQQLRQKLKQTDKQIIDLQIKLTKLLNQHNQNHNDNYSQRDTFKKYNMELYQKQQQINKMNKQFSFQIQKYNTVFQAMKQQLNQLKSYQDIDLIQQIQRLETEIIRLRQEKQRDQMIIQELRDRLQQFDQSYDRRKNSRAINRNFPTSKYYRNIGRQY